MINELQLRQSLVNGENETPGTFSNPEDYNDSNAYDSDNPDLEVPENVYMDEDIPPSKEVWRLVIILSLVLDDIGNFHYKLIYLIFNSMAMMVLELRSMKV